MQKVDVREVLRREFECKVLGTVAIGVERGTGKVYLKLYGAAVGEDDEALPVPEVMSGTPCEGGSTYTPSNFIHTRPRKPEPTDEDLAAWAQQVFDRASSGLPVLLSSIVIGYLEGVAHLLEETGHPDDYAEEEVIQDQLTQIENYLRGLLESPKRGKRSKWTRFRIERAVQRALKNMKVKDRTLDNVAAILRNKHPESAPVSGEALGALLKRFEISWRKIKTDD